MKILLIHHRMPYPLESGMDKVRFNLIRALAEKHKVFLIFPYDKNLDNVIPEILASICFRIIKVPVRPVYKLIKTKRKYYIKRFIYQLLYKIPTYITNDFQFELAEVVKRITMEENFDAVQTLSDVTSKYMEYVGEKPIRIYGPMDDTLASAWSDMLAENKIKKKVGWLMEYLARRKWQTVICKKGDILFFFSNKDRDHLLKKTKKQFNSYILPAIVEKDNIWDKNKLYNVESNTIIFVGGLGSLFNKHAARYFIKNIFPHIRKEIPQVKLYIVGHSPDTEILSYNSKNIIVTGKVSNVSEYIQKASVYVSPLFAGSGFKTKIVEALRFGKPIVTTEAGIQGLWDLGKDAIVISNKPKEFSDEVIKLLKNDTLRIKRSLEARALFENTYTYEKVAPKILEIYKEIEKFTNS